MAEIKRASADLQKERQIENAIADNAANAAKIAYLAMMTGNDDVVSEDDTSDGNGSMHMSVE